MDTWSWKDLIEIAITVLITLQVERRKADREADALRKSLGIELRLQIARALDVHASLQRLGSKPDGTISAKMVERASRSGMPAAIIYSANAGKTRRTWLWSTRCWRARGAKSTG